MPHFAKTKTKKGCATEGHPGVYGETWQYMDWITSTTGLTGQ